MQGGYMILGRSTASELADAVNQYMVGGWVPQGGVFKGTEEIHNAAAISGMTISTQWFQAMALPPEALEQYREEEDRIALEEATRITTPGKQALGAEEYEEEGK